MNRRTINRAKAGQNTLLKRTPKPPEGMKGIALEWWEKKCADLIKEGYLSSLILESLEAYCNVLADMARCREEMNKAWGTDRFFRYQKAYNEANKLQISMAREFGFTSTSANKVEVTKPRKKPVFNLNN